MPAHRDSVATPIGPTALLDSAYDTAIENPIVLDTNDARLYYEAGLAARSVDPAGASAAFYWASRIDPSWAQPYFARWYLLSRIAQQRTVSLRSGPVRSAPLPDSIRVRIDSLAVMAFSRDPFFDDGMTMTDLSRQLRAQVGLYNANRHAVISRINDNRLRAGQPPLMDNSGDATVPHEWFIAYGNRDFASAALLLAPLIKRHPDALVYYVYRAKAQFFLKQYDSASATMQAAVTR
ncbi:MAG TPA: hypothetical protein VNW46_07105, partial [Gemmatimonadaceae bacterium]|nr:hypothetical protein [Gemmatimonadaceae bacterium]